jgi:hypothetical protein
MQAKMMWIMPLAFSVMFFFFPAGLVLYWITNNILSIAQQWLINKRMGVLAGVQYAEVRSRSRTPSSPRRRGPSIERALFARTKESAPCSPASTDPIAAIATAPGRGAVGIVRVSGRRRCSRSSMRSAAAR